MTETFNLKKVCEVCQKPIGDSFGNLLCLEHYAQQSKEIEDKVKTDEEDKNVKGFEFSDTIQSVTQDKDAGHVRIEEDPEAIDPDKVRLQEVYKESKKGEEITEMGEPGSQKPDSSIKDPKYMENPEAPDKDQIMANLAQFVKTDILLYQHQLSMYTFIKDYMCLKAQRHAQFSKHIWKPRAVDVGCGSGVGANILSWEADLVWGIDKNKKSISFAKQAFTREKNGIYYSSQVIFDQLDIINTEFEFDRFDIVVAIEIIEHVNDWRTMIQKMISNFAKKNKNGTYADKTHSGTNGDFYDGTEYFISTPNRNNSRISNERPKNIFHVREWTAPEFFVAMGEFFEHVELYSWTGEKVDVDTTHTPIFAKCRKPK